jgi:predicted enzyme related to lactoylglutathione lyase
MKTQGITWNAVVTDDFDKTVAFFKDTFGLTPGVEFPGFAMFPHANGGILEVYAEDNTPDYGFNGGAVFGFRVEDIEATSAELAAAGVELLGAINRLDTGYAYRHFRGPDGKIYGLNEDPQAATP